MRVTALMTVTLLGVFKTWLQHEVLSFTRKKSILQVMSTKITGELFALAASHIRDVVMVRDPPPLGFKRGQAVGLVDNIAQLVVFQGLVEKFEDSLLNRLQRDINPIATRRVFCQFMDGQRTPEHTLAVCVEIAKASGHEATGLECCTTYLLLDEARMIQNSISVKIESYSS